MKKFFVTGLLIAATSFLFAQKNADAIINSKEAERIEKVLASDEMQGRKTFTPGIDKAADFIAQEFAKSKLKFWGNSQSYFQDFTMTKAKVKEISGTLDGETLNDNNVAANTTSGEIHITSLKDYEVVYVKKGDDF